MGRTPPRRKDYGETVRFPVEIVGRDGVVRRHDFASSVRLYERRAARAASRVAGEDDAAKEIAHCRARIAQLRRSYLHLHGWLPAGQPDDPSDVDLGMAAHVADLLMSVLRHPDRLGVEFTLVRRELSRWIWQLEVEGAGTFQLYAWQAEASTTSRWAPRLIASAAAGDAEVLIGRARCDRWQLALSGRAGDHGWLTAAAAADESARGDAWTPSWLRQVHAQVVRGDLEAALAGCLRRAQRRGWDPEPYALGAVLAWELGEVGQAEDLCCRGATWAAADPALWLVLAHTRLRRGAWPSAISSWRRAEAACTKEGASWGPACAALGLHLALRRPWVVDPLALLARCVARAAWPSPLWREVGAVGVVGLAIWGVLMGGGDGMAWRSAVAWGGALSSVGLAVTWWRVLRWSRRRAQPSARRWLRAKGLSR